MKFKILLVSLFILMIMNALAQEIKRVEPPNWWIGMENPNVQLLIYGDNIAELNVSIKNKDLKLLKVNKTENKNYLFLDLEISKTAKAGIININFKKENKSFNYEYELKKRENNPDNHKGFYSSDAIYLIMPDRFSNGNPENDNVEGMLEKADRNNPDGRHGGDLQGIRNNLKYISDLGFTAIWINPVLENNMPRTTYHGYAITDFYKIDPRHGSNQDYKQLVDESHKNGLKVIMDMVFNHCGSSHWWMKDLPSKDWLHQFPEFTRTNYRAPVVSDPYSSEIDDKLIEKGWFDITMPDLNQDNKFLANYLIQNSIWWIEYSGIDGIRMDTYPYPEKNMMANWVKAVLKEYPKFNIVGETWLQKESMTAYWQKDAKNKDGYNSHLPSVTDFPIHFSLIKALNNEDTWTGGIMELYYVLAQDFVYTNPNLNLIFPDNHDLRRIYSSLNHNYNKFKIAMAFILTTRGIPQIYYGTEILMDGNDFDGHGQIRQDFPGGWKGDKINAFKQENLSKEKIEAFNYVKKLLNWRKNKDVIHNGKLKHFIPENSVYVYFRYTENQAVMIIINKNNSKLVNTKRFSEILNKYSKAVDIISDEKITDLENIWMEGLSVRILELEK
ncbi:MAG: glycoside hydrolase family 13 protein [Bacteroidales bacterium]|nr:glycoside hydrolase family 13 protein [Bacteroidales bacterium]